MHLLPFILPLIATATATPNLLTKRCSPQYDPDVAHGYYPPAPCWQTFNPACQPFLSSSTEMTLDAKHKTAVIYGVSDYCAAEIAEELAREAAGRKNFGWIKKHGNLTFIPSKRGKDSGILVISDMEDAAVERYAKLTYESVGRPQ